MASVARTVMFFTHNPVEDSTWASVLFTSWAVVETSCYLMAACLICLRPALRFVAGKTKNIKLRYPKLLSLTSKQASIPSEYSSNVIITRDIQLTVVPEIKLSTSSVGKDEEDGFFEL